MKRGGRHLLVLAPPHSGGCRQGTYGICDRRTHASMAKPVLYVPAGRLGTTETQNAAPGSAAIAPDCQNRRSGCLLPGLRTVPFWYTRERHTQYAGHLEPCPGHPNAMHQRCTSDAPAMHQREPVVHPVCTAGASLVHDPKSGRGGWHASVVCLQDGVFALLASCQSDTGERRRQSTRRAQTVPARGARSVEVR